MALVSPSQSNPGDTIEAADINNPVNQIAAQVNGNLDSTNLADSAVSTSKLADNAVTEAKMQSRASEYLADFVASGGVIAQSAGLTGTFSNIVYYIDGIRYTKSSVANKAYTASKDTYVDIDSSGNVTYNEVANGASAPSLSAGNIRLAKVVTSGAAITSVTQTGSDSLGNLLRNLEPYFQSSWQSWTPTWTNLTVGNGTLDYARYKQVGKNVEFRLKFTLGSTSSVGTTPSFTLPVTSHGDYMAVSSVLGGTNSRDSSTSAVATGFTYWASATTANPTYFVVSGSQVNRATFTSTTPFTWATGDIIECSGSYEAAAI
jgi:hypothetical protein